MKQLLSLNEVIEVTTERLAYGGEAVAKHNGITIFVQGAAPEERLRVRVSAIKKRYARARIEEILTPSRVRREPICPYFGICGGCQLQHVSYPVQLEAKVGFIRDAIRRIGGIEWTEPIEMRSAAEYGYRSRARIQVERHGDEQAVGFHLASSDSICDVELCPILQPSLNSALTRIRSHPIVKADTHSPSRSEIHIASGDSIVGVAPTLDQIESATQNGATTFSQQVLRTVNDFRYRFPPDLFFQANGFLLEDFVNSAVYTESGELALDLYAGVGLFSLPLAQRFRHVVAVESNPLAAQYARMNVEANGVDNASVVNEPAETWLRNIAIRRDYDRPDFLLLDPPRSGAADAIDLIAQIGPKRITYVSCDPNTMARDLKTVTRHGYRLTRVIGFDLFPQTFHVESIITVERRVA